jgi:hypothetical protein
MQELDVHTHSEECLGGNELDEICCAHIGDNAERLSNSDRWVVTLKDASTVNVFTDVIEDAYALAEAHSQKKAIYARKDPQQWP